MLLIHFNGVMGMWYLMRVVLGDESPLLLLAAAVHFACAILLTVIKVRYENGRDDQGR